MATIWIKEFTGGLDARRLPETTPGGVLLKALNGHISRGGEFEKRAAFIKIAQLPPGTVGLGYTNAGLMVWGSGAKPTVNWPSNIQYQQLQHIVPATKLTVVNSFDLFKGYPYVSTTFADGDEYHFYKGARVADLVYGCAKCNFKVTGGSNITGTVSRGKFKITGGTNAVSNKITAVYVNGVKITQKTIQHTGSNTTTAQKVAAEINRWVSTPNYTAVVNGTEITVYATTVGVGVNGKMIQVAKTGNVTTNAPVNMVSGTNHVASTVDLKVVGGTPARTIDLMRPVEWKSSNALTAKAIVAEINAFRSVREFRAVWDGADGVAVTAIEPGVWANNMVLTPTYTNGFTTNITAATKLVGGTDAATPVSYQPGDFVMTIGSKMYALSGSVMHFSEIADPTIWRPSVPAAGGEGFIDMAMVASGAGNLMSLANYQTYVAIFAQDAILVYYVDPSPSLYKISQVLNNTGTRSLHSVTQFGDNDVFYLDESGIRSLRARDSSNSAATADIGVLVDPLVVAKLQTLTSLDRNRVFGLIEPTEGRFWLIMRNLIFVFSYFAGAKVSAWSTYIPSITTTAKNADGVEVDTDTVFTIDEAVVFRRRIYVRSGDSIYCYGGEAATLGYDRTEAVMQTPFFDANAPAKSKNYSGWDAAVRGLWSIYAHFDPNNLPAMDHLGTIYETTYPANRMPMQGGSTHVSLEFKTRDPMLAKVGSGLIHYASEGEDDASK